MVVTKAKPKRTSRYGVLSNIEFVIDAGGLATGTNNSYGDIDGSNGINSIKSIAPGTTGLDFTVNGSGVTYNPTTKAIDFNGSGRLRYTGAASLFNFLSYHASGYASLKWTVFAVVKFGTSIKPSSASYGLFGNTGGTSSSKGAWANYANNTTNEDFLQTAVVKGTTNQYLGRMTLPGVCPSNQWIVVALQFDGSASAALRMRMFINDQGLVNNEQLQNDTTPVTTPTYAMEIGGVGNGVLPLVGSIKKVVMCSNVFSYDNTVSFIRMLMNENNIVRSRSSYLDVSTVPQIFDQDTASNYKFCAVIGQDPSNKERILSAYTVGSDHIYTADKKLVFRTSVNKGASFGSQTTIDDPTNPDAVQDIGGGVDSNGKAFIWYDIMNSGSAGGNVAMKLATSTDWSTWTLTDVTANLPADSLAGWRSYGNMVHANGIWVKGFYKFTDNGVFTNSANYIWRSTDGVNFTAVTIRASGSTFITEPTVVYMGGNNWLAVIRHETTLEWRQYISTDNALTWTDQGDVTFGETVTSANPCVLKSFTHNGQRVIVCYLTNRNNDTAFAIYALPANLVSSGVSGWNSNTKIMWWKTALAPWHYHYGDVAHIDDTVKAFGLFPYDPYPGSGGTTNKMNYTTMPTWHISKIESELGI